MSNEVRKIWENLMKSRAWKKIARDTLIAKKADTVDTIKKVKKILNNKSKNIK